MVYSFINKRIVMKKQKCCLLMLLVFLVLNAFSQQDPGDTVWTPLFNGKDLANWDIKISGHTLNENYMNIFSVKDGILRVSYDRLDSFRGEFGHLFTRQEFSHYKLRVEYRFTGDQCPGGPVWGLRNSGAMLHSQSAESMEFDQDFPVSVEAQFLGGLGEGDRTTANVCTPGTDIDFNGQPVEGHCTRSTSGTYNGDQWVMVEMIVLGDCIAHHIVNGDTVLTYTRMRIGPDMKPAGFSIPDGTPLKKGHIALQAESHNVEFRRVELLDLSCQ